MDFLPPPLSLALAGIGPDLWGGGVRGMLSVARAAGFRAVALDGTMTGIRARDLDRSGRRDLAALLRRTEIACSGIDLWIPPEHFADSARIDRALSATVEAIALAADLSRLAGSGVVNPGQTGALRSGRTISIVLAPATPPEALRAIRERADSCSVRIADCAWPARSSAQSGSQESPEHDPIGVGLDPATVLQAGGDPVNEVTLLTISRRLSSARLSDAGPIGRVAPGSGSGRLDLAGYAASLAAGGYTSHVPLDLRGVPDQAGAMTSALEAWSGVSGPARGVG